MFNISFELYNSLYLFFNVNNSLLFLTFFTFFPKFLFSFLIISHCFSNCWIFLFCSSITFIYSLICFFNSLISFSFSSILFLFIATILLFLLLFWFCFFWLLFIIFSKSFIFWIKLAFSFKVCEIIFSFWIFFFLIY